MKLIRINPFKTSHVEDFNFGYFLIGLIGIMYGALSWRAHYSSSAKNAHEAKMGSVLAGLEACLRECCCFSTGISLCLHESS